MMLTQVALADAQGASDLLGDDNTPQIVDPANNASCFHISSLLVNSRIAILLFVIEGGLYCSNNRTLFSNLFQSFPSISLAIIAELCYILE